MAIGVVGIEPTQPYNTGSKPALVSN